MSALRPLLGAVCANTPDMCLRLAVLGRDVEVAGEVGPSTTS